MKAISILFVFLALTFSLIYGEESVILTTVDGHIIKAYNLDRSEKYIYYTLSTDANDFFYRISQSEILLIDNNSLANPPQYNRINELSVVTTNSKIRNGEKQLEDSRIICVFDSLNQELTMRIISDDKKTLALTKPRKGLKYSGESYIIPDSVDIDGVKYSVERIDEYAFMLATNQVKIHLKNTNARNNNIKNLVLPSTLKEIGDYAFACSASLSKIFIPESVQWIGDYAFYQSGHHKNVEIYIPRSVIHIGKDAFRNIGVFKSFRGFFQGRILCLPEFVNGGNCTTFGLDEEAVENYYSRER